MLEITRDGGVVILAFDDAARRNAMTPELGDALRDAVRSLPSDARAVVLTGNGGAFSAGGDLKMLERLRTSSRDESRAFMRSFYARYLSILDVPVPTIAAIDGPAIGAGLCVALACDLVIAARDSKLAVNFVQLGLHPGMGATYLVPRRVGAERAAELLWTGRRFDGAEAAAMGLVLSAVDNAREEALRVARAIASNAPLAVQAMKRSFAVDRAALDAALDFEAEQQSVSYASEDLGEGLAAAAAKRAPVFHGR